MPSTAAQVIISVIPIVGIVMGAFVLFSYLYYSYRQRIIMIEKNIIQKKTFDLDSFSLFAGLVLTGTGLSLVVFFLIKEGFNYGVLSGLIPLSIGISLLIFFIVKLRLRNEK